MKIQIGQPKWFTEIGRKDNQEDCLWPNPLKVSTNQRIFIMCDGVGGQDSGEVASETAATSIGVYLTSHKSKDGYITESLFNEALSYAYDELDKKDTGSQKKMGTTMTCVVLHRGGAFVAHIGDSRIYHVRPSLADEQTGRSGIIYQSADHSLVNDLLRAGELTEEEAKTFPQKNVITRAMQPHLERRCKADIYNLDDIQAGDYFFLCCDGVLEQMTNEKLGSILAEDTLDDDGKIAAIKSICDGNTKDNYTCWLIPITNVETEITDVKGEEEIEVQVEPIQQSVMPTAPISFKEESNTSSLARPVTNEQPKGKGKGLIVFVLLLVLALGIGAWFGRSYFSTSNLIEVDDSTNIEKQDSSRIDSVKKTAKKSENVANVAKDNEPPKAPAQVKEKLNEQKQQVTSKPEEMNSVDAEKTNDSKVKNTLLKNNNQTQEQPDGKLL